MAGLFTRLRTALTGSEARAGGGVTFAPSYPVTAAGAAVTPWAAENLATVLACVNAIATGLATLPATVYRAEGEGRVEAPNHPVARLLRAPNEHQTWPDWAEWTVGQALLWGNALSVVVSDGAGRPTALQPVPWQNVTATLLPNGRLAYDVVAYQTPWGSTGTPRRFLDTEAFHLRDRSDDGLLGRSRLSRAPSVLANALGLQTYSGAIWSNAATPSGLVTLPQGIKPEGIRRAEAAFNGRFAGADNAKRVMLVDADTKFTPMAVSPEDAEVLDSRRFTVIELCRLFNVPPPIVQSYENNTFTNAATASVWFAQNTLMPWARKIEAEFARSVFADPSGAFHLEIDLSGLTRGDYSTRWLANVQAVQAGILTADEIRAQEGYGPLPKKEAEPAAPPQAVIADANASELTGSQNVNSVGDDFT